MSNPSIVRENQQPLMETYVKHPEKAMITDVAIIKGEDLDDPFHTTVLINDELQTPFRVGVHRAVGGLHDYPNPGDLLCASLASCFETTMRLIANRLRLTLLHTRVKATADVDVRGTLMVDRETPVHFQSMTLDVELKVGEASEGMIGKLIKGTETCCIIFQTVKRGIPIAINVTLLNDQNA